MPALFIGHGSPMNIIQENLFTQHLKELGEKLPRPKAIVVVSAHWQTRKTLVSIVPKPEIKYDFYGFPKELYSIAYPCDGMPDLAYEIIDTLKQFNIKPDRLYGLDHGAWSILRFLFPEGDIPVVEMSIEPAKSYESHFDFGFDLGFLRDKGVLVIGSGNMVHNLKAMSPDMNAEPLDWAVAADELFKEKLLAKDFESLLDPDFIEENAKLAVPTTDHYIPMLYIAGMMEETDTLTFTYEGIQNASISMRSFIIQSPQEEVIPEEVLPEEEEEV